MRRCGGLFEQACSYANLHLATKRAVRGKITNPDVARFHMNREFELLSIQEELLSGAYQPRTYHCFTIYEPKKRTICAAVFRDRVIHHAICNILEPIFERFFIHDSYACRRDKGTHRAVNRVRKFLRADGYFLKTDVKKFFDSIDHGILKALLRCKIKDSRFLKLLDTIIDHPMPNQICGKGLPIGNLTSQWWANFYLDQLDHYLKDQLGVRRYVRYMDDIVVVNDNKDALHNLRVHVDSYLKERLELRLKQDGTFVAPVTEGVPFLGFRIFPNLIRLKRTNLVRFRRNFREKEKAYLSGEMDEDRFTRSAASMLGHVQHADTWRMRRDFFYGKDLG